MRVQVIFLIFILFSRGYTLSEGEIRAISAIGSNWPFLYRQSPPWLPNSSKACDRIPFKGITCSDGPEKHIIGLSLDGKMYSGAIPDEIGELLWLRNLKLNVNLIVGAIPDTFGNLTNLEVLDVRVESPWNEPMPLTITNLVDLIQLKLELNAYTHGLFYAISSFKQLSSLVLICDGSSLPETLPSSFCDLRLTNLWIEGTSLRGLDICKGRFPNLTVLQLKKAHLLEAPIDSILLDRPHLISVSISDTPVFGDLNLNHQRNLELLKLESLPVSGTIPSSLWKNLKLRTLSLISLSVSGTLSAEIGQLTSLNSFVLSEIQISGTIPTELGHCLGMQSLTLSTTRLSGTIPSSLGNLANLTHLVIASSPLTGGVPNFSKLKSLQILTISACGVEGELSSDLLDLPNLVQLSLSQNRLNGSIPNKLPALTSFHIHSNSLTGSIPRAIWNIGDVDISNNLLSGRLFGPLNDVPSRNFKASNNELFGPLPTFPPNIQIVNSIDLSYNRFQGTIPSQYQQLPIYSINLSNNDLEGPIIPLLKNDFLNVVDLRVNRLNGSIPASCGAEINKMFLSNNIIGGTVPILPPKLRQLWASRNLLNGSLDAMISQLPTTLESLDLSENSLEGTLPSYGFFNKFSFLKLSSNNLSGTIAPLYSRLESKLQHLDLSNNHLSGQFKYYAISHTPISTLILSNNSFTGNLAGMVSTRLTTLDVSHNLLNFDASSLPEQPYLTFLSASSNSISGTLSLHVFSSLISADFRNNQLSGVNFQSITDSSLRYKLTSLSISNNSGLVDNRLGQYLNSGALTATNAVIPSITHTGVICSKLAFGNGIDTEFEYDEAMFYYQQCRCDRDHFGAPPLHCFRCMDVGTSPSNCSGYQLSVDINYYVYEGAHSTKEPLEIEPCLPEDYRILGKSNCAGLEIKFDTSGNRVFSWETGMPYGGKQNSIIPSGSQLDHQCQIGSAGRLCSRCTCDSTSCYFPGPANLCEKCGKVFSPSVSIPVSIAVILAVTVLLSIIFYLILAGKRRSKDKKWENVSIGKRIVYRIIDMTSFGQITIAVAFIQILVEVTHWDAYALNTWLKLLNGESEGLGLRCFFPFLENPLILLIFRLSVPFVVIGIVCTSIGLGELLYRAMGHIRSKRQVYEDQYSDVDSDFGNHSISLLKKGESRLPKSSSYPALALISSTSISIIKFFYFGTTMSAFEYLFYSVQKGTNKKFVQSVPWMAYSEARTIQMISIPFILVFMLGIPLAFVILSWKLRHKIASPFVRLYFGSLFENFRSRLFWWELVNILRKLSVALFLRGLAPNDSFQLILVSFVLISLGILMVGLKPWKLTYENWFEGIGSILLIFSFASGRLGDLRNARSATIVLLSLDCAFVISCVAIIIWRSISDETSYEKQWKLRFGDAHDTSHLTNYGPPLLNITDSGLDLGGIDSEQMPSEEEE